jgi:cholesterol transport system auxiliary component
MNTLDTPALAPRRRLLAAGLSLMALGACSALRPASAPQTVFYALNAAPAAAPKAAPDTAPTLMINPPHAAAGFDSARIIYVREPHKLEYFAHSEWVDPPARMLSALLVDALARSGAFRAVVPSPGAATGDLRLDTEIIRLQHEFQTQPSRVRFTMRAYLVDDKTRRVLAWREFDAYAAATSEDPHGGVIAANRAVQTVLDELSQFLTERQK